MDAALLASLAEPVRVTVPLPTRVGDAEVFSQTTLEAAGAESVLVISTAVPDHGLVLRTVYVGAGGDASGVAIDVTLSPKGRSTTHRVLPDVPVTHARGRCLTDHAAALQGELQSLTAQPVGVDVSDDAFILASQAYPPPDDPETT